MAKLCLGCHEPQPGLMMGLADNISIKAQILQINLDGRKDYVKFNNITKLVNLKSISEIRNYLGAGFSITYQEVGEEKFASKIHRFDIETALKNEDKVDKGVVDRLIVNQKGYIVDVRPPIDFVTGHIPKAIMIPATEFDRFKDKLPSNKDSLIVLYGDNNCFGITSLKKMREIGYTSTKVYTNGYRDWIKTEYGITESQWLRSAILNDHPHVLIDLRNEEEVRDGHIKDTLNISYPDLSSEIKRLPTLPQAPIIFYGPRAEDAAQLAVKQGYSNVHILPITFTQWKVAGNPVEKGPAKQGVVHVERPIPGTISITEFQNILKTGTMDRYLIVDVRNANEYNRDNIPGSLNIPADIIGRMLDKLSKEKEVLLYCNTGVLAEIAYNILKKEGYESRYLKAVVTFDDGEVDIEPL
ncbi:MAG: rhodanese-like domain-containing protein [Desulfobulbaceae bacterium]|nr:rhodanese-like domain-containing protein [Desulfobulbaceae bacterium]